MKADNTVYSTPVNYKQSRQAIRIFYAYNTGNLHSGKLLMLMYSHFVIGLLERYIYRIVDVPVEFLTFMLDLLYLTFTSLCNLVQV